MKQENPKRTTINEEKLKARSKEIKTLKAIATMTLLGLKPTSKYHK